jgi:predicted transposase YbfD/YdcC
MQCITEVRATHTATAAQICSLYQQLQAVPDYRSKRGRRYEAATVMVIVLLAKLAGEESVSGIAQWARLRAEWLQSALGLVRLPCANTYAYICAHLDMSELNAQIATYFEQLSAAEVGAAPAVGSAELVALEHWALDGKVLRGSHRQAPPSQSGQEVLNVYAVAQGYLKHCQPIASKGYEAAGAQAFIGQSDCLGKVITADALHTRPRFCRQIRRQHGEYVLIVKRNRPELEAEIRQLFALPPDPSYPVQQARTVDKGHGRLTVRQLSTSSELHLAVAAEWRDAAQVFLLERWVTRHGKTTYESVCGITSLSADEASPAKLLALVRAHWQIENRCHWRRDATLGEDRCTVRQARVAMVLAVLNSAILALFDRCKISNARKARRAFDAHPHTALALLI